MNRWIIATLLIGLITGTGFAQKPGPGYPGKKPGPGANPEMMKIMQQVQVEKTRMQMAEYEAELEFKRNMRNLELRERELELERIERELHRPDHGDAMHQRHKKMKEAHDLMVLVCLIVHVLMAIWVYQDIRKRKTGSGIWIVITLLVGFFGMVPYAIIRLGNKET